MSMKFLRLLHDYGVQSLWRFLNTFMAYFHGKFTTKTTTLLNMKMDKRKGEKGWEGNSCQNQIDGKISPWYELRKFWDWDENFLLVNLSLSQRIH